jgi:invasion protein IalB
MRRSKFITTLLVMVGLLSAGMPVLQASAPAEAATTISGLPARWESISSPGTGTTCGLATNGSIWCWGMAEGPRGVAWNTTQGDPAAGSSVEPKRVGTAANWVKVEVATNHACAMNTTGEIWCWGSNNFGQLGLGTYDATQTPRLVKSFGKIWTDFSVSRYKTCALTTASLWCWGQQVSNLNLATQVSDGALTISPASKVFVGDLLSVFTAGKIFYRFSTSTGFRELTAPTGTTWTKLTVRKVGLIDVPAATSDLAPHIFSLCAIASSGIARCYNKWEMAKYAQLGDFTDWRDLGELSEIPREPVCGLRGQGDTITCFNPYSFRNYDFKTVQTQSVGLEMDLSAFTNKRVYPYHSWNGIFQNAELGIFSNEGTWRYSIWGVDGVMDSSNSIDVSLPNDVDVSKLHGSWFQGTFAPENQYSVWGRMYALASDGRVFVIGDGKYGERQDGLANGTVTDTWAQALVQDPLVSSSNRTLIPKTGGASISLTGSFLVGVSGVTVGGVAVDTWTENADGTGLTFMSPASAAGTSADVVVTTSSGTATLTGVMSFGDAPSAPTLTGINPLDGAVSVNWSAPSSLGTSAVTGYTVTLTPGGRSCTWSVGPLTCTITGLQNGTTYRATVQAVSNVGPGLASAQSAAFVPFRAPSAPTITSVVEADGEITVSWTAPNNGGSAITRYDVEAQPGGSSCSTAGTGTSCTITGVSNGTAYSISVYATNDAGSGEIGVASNSATPRTLPGSPTITGISAADRQLTVNWRAPSLTGGAPVTSYTAIAQPGSITCTAVAPSTNCTLLGLSNGSVYTVTVLATNAAGNSAESASQTSSPVTIPGKPSISAVEPSANSALVRWRAPSTTGGASVTSYRVLATPGGASCSTTGAEFSCLVTGLENGTTYTFTVTATNNAGVGTASSTFNGVPSTVPGVPRNVNATPLNAGLKVTWSAPTYDGGTAVTGYTATVRSTGDTCTVAATVLTCTITGLVNGQDYIVDVTANNNSGRSEEVGSNTVTPRTTPSQPIQVKVTPGAGIIRVSWGAPASNGGSAITSYVATATPGVNLTCTSAGLYCDIVGVNAGTSYSITVLATNAAGAGTASTAVTAVPFTTPTAPTSVTAVADDGAIDVSWAAPTANGGSDISGYMVLVSPGNFSCETPSTTLNCLVTGLTNGTQYTVKVLAINLAGDGAQAQITNKIVPRGLPVAPTIISVDSDDQKLVVKWRALSGAGLNGSAITKYTAVASPSGKSCNVVGSTNGVANTTCTITGLTNGALQNVTVFATNAAGDSAKSSGVNRIPRSAPKAPVVKLVEPLNGGLSIEWTAPVDTGGVLITGYTVIATPATGAATSCAPQSGESRNCVINGLANGTEYSVTVLATNEVGTGPSSAAKKSVPATVPSAPTKVRPTIGNGEIAVRWEASAGNGSAINSYTVVLQPGNLTCVVEDLTFLGCTISDLDNGVPYSVAVFATNDIGDSPKGQITGTATPRAVPAAPASVSVSAATSQATISWVPGFNGGSSISNYLVVATPGGGQCTAPGNATQCVITNLVNGTQYTFKVTASNDAGTSQPALSGKVLIAGTPNAPVALKVKPSDGQLAISFAPPALNGGSAVTNYEVYVNDELACTVTPAKTLGCTVRDLENGAPHVVYVVANNAVGTSVASPEVVASPGRISDPVTGVTATTGLASITVSWVEPFDDGGSPITGYAVTLTPGGKTCKAEADATSCEIKGLTVGTSYSAKVVAINGVGTSVAASSSVVKVTGPPTVVRNLSATAIAKGAKLYFAGPSNNGGSPILNYVFTITGPKGEIGSPIEVAANKIKSTYTVTGLTKGVTYTITVQVENEYGTSVAATVKVKSK